ncbi:MAG TPA: EF-Tu/IF-2/RF-3 family GTPase [Pyrinomonadaceae bacterium]|nr:EF-Tu/IF-2/RF-3 family GTPase [Pyrinomonadaceae bacterium]
MKFILPLIAFLAFTVSASAQKPTPTPKPEPFLMAVEDVFSISGRGTVVTGKVERGSIKVGDAIEIVGIVPTKTATVSGIEMFRKMLTEAKAGENVGIMLRGIEKTDVKRGQVLAKPGSIKAYTTFTATIELLSAKDAGRSTPMADNYRPQLQVRTSSFSATVKLPAGTSSVAPGTKGVVVQLTLTEPAPLEIGQVFAIREAGRTVGNGTVTKLLK